MPLRRSLCSDFELILARVEENIICMMAEVEGIWVKADERRWANEGPKVWRRLQKASIVGTLRP